MDLWIDGHSWRAASRAVRRSPPRAWRWMRRPTLARPRVPRPAANTDRTAAPPTHRPASRPRASPEPVGVDPDDVQFAWHMTDARRGAAERLPDRGHRPRSRISKVWDSGRGRTRTARRSCRTPDRRCSADSRYHWTVRTADGAGHWSGPSRPAAIHHGAARSRTGPRRGCARSRPTPARRSTPTFARRRALPEGTVAYATAYVAAAPQVPVVGERRQGRRRSELLLPRRAVLPGHRHHHVPLVPGRATPSGSCTTGTGRAVGARRRPRASSSR